MDSVSLDVAVRTAALVLMVALTEVALAIFFGAMFVASVIRGRVSESESTDA